MLQNLLRWAQPGKTPRRSYKCSGACRSQASARTVVVVHSYSALGTLKMGSGIWCAGRIRAKHLTVHKSVRACVVHMCRPEQVVALIDAHPRSSALCSKSLVHWALIGNLSLAPSIQALLPSILARRLFQATAAAAVVLATGRRSRDVVVKVPIPSTPEARCCHGG